MNIIYDADGMVINKPFLFSQSLAKDHDIPPEKITPFFLNEFQPCEVGKADLKEVIKPFLFQWGWQGTVDELLQYWFKTEHYIDQRIADHIKQLRARGHKCYLGTNQEKYRVEYMRKEMGLENVFDKIFVSCEIGFKKPAKEFYKVVGNIDLIWDDKRTIVEAARELGYRAELYIGFEDYIEKIKAYENFRY